MSAKKPLNEPRRGTATVNLRDSERSAIYCVDVRLGTATGPILGQLRDISTSGAFIETHANPRQTEFQLTFIIRNTDPPRQIRTYVQWVRADLTGIGVQFLAIEDEDVAMLHALAAKRVGVYQH